MLPFRGGDLGSLLVLARDSVDSQVTTSDNEHCPVAVCSTEGAGHWFVVQGCGPTVQFDYEALVLDEYSVQIVVEGQSS